MWLLGSSVGQNEWLTVTTAANESSSNCAVIYMCLTVYSAHWDASHDWLR